MVDPSWIDYAVKFSFTLGILLEDILFAPGIFEYITMLSTYTLHKIIWFHDTLCG